MCVHVSFGGYLKGNATHFKILCTVHYFRGVGTCKRRLSVRAKNNNDFDTCLTTRLVFHSFFYIQTRFIMK